MDEHDSFSSSNSIVGFNACLSLVVTAANFLHLDTDSGDSSVAQQDDSDCDVDYSDPGSVPSEDSTDSDSENNCRRRQVSTQSRVTHNGSEGASTSGASHSDAVFTPVAISTPNNSSSSSQCSLGITMNRSRKRKRNVETWIRTKKSKSYNSGNRKTGAITTKRGIGERCRCKRAPCSLISDDQREKIFNVFWNAESNKQSRHGFIIAHTEKKGKIRCVANAQKQREDTIKYYLTVESRKYKVCQQFFLNTLSISTQMVLYNLKKTVNGVRELPAKRLAHNRTPDDDTAAVRKHIESFPKIESHYCRAETKREYLESHLSIRKMFNEFKETNSANSIKEHTYRKVFNEQYNLGFHKPSKDQCDTCDNYKKLPRPTDEQRKLQEAHLRRKVQAYDSKENDKKNNGSLAVTFDLQQVLTVPRLFAGSTYYKRKLNMYNLTFYELHSKNGHCYWWTEAEAHRGANDIATAVVKYLELVDQSGKYREVVLYSDTCGGQNRNKVMATALLSFLTKSHNVKRIFQKFFESGHSHMECDSMHSAIESASAQKEIELPSDYVKVIKEARRGQPYHITELCHEDIKDYSALNSSVMAANAFKGIINVHEIIYSTGDVKLNPTIEMSEEIGGVKRSISYRKRGGQHQLTNVNQCYSQQPGIKEEKKRDLLSMISCFTNKSIARLYYNSLPICE